MSVNNKIKEEKELNKNYFVYKYLDEDYINIYTGQHATDRGDISKRVGQHKNAPKDRDLINENKNIFYAKCPSFSYMDNLEKMIIDKESPKYNKLKLPYDHSFDPGDIKWIEWKDNTNRSRWDIYNDLDYNQTKTKENMNMLYILFIDNDHNQYRIKKGYFEYISYKKHKCGPSYCERCGGANIKVVDAQVDDKYYGKFICCDCNERIGICHKNEYEYYQPFYVGEYKGEYRYYQELEWNNEPSVLREECYIADKEIKKVSVVFETLYDLKEFMVANIRYANDKKKEYNDYLIQLNNRCESFNNWFNSLFYIQAKGEAS